jgi:hypothetical protein
LREFRAHKVQSPPDDDELRLTFKRHLLVKESAISQLNGSSPPGMEQALALLRELHA